MTWEKEKKAAKGEWGKKDERGRWMKKKWGKKEKTVKEIIIRGRKKKEVVYEAEKRKGGKGKSLRMHMS